MKDIEKIVENLKEIIEILEANKIDDTETTSDSVKKFIESVAKPGHVVDFSHIPVVDNLFMPIPQEELEEMPDIRYFHITDSSNILGNGMGSKYPLFIKDGNDPRRLIINYDIMKEFLYRDDVKIRISFAFKSIRYTERMKMFGISKGIITKLYEEERGSGACAVFKPSEVTVHVGTTTLTGEKEDGTTVEIRAKNWRDLHFARVAVRKII